MVVASNPPTTAGTRTANRTNLARAILGFDVVETSNIFALPSYRTGEIRYLGASERGWLLARAQLVEALDRAHGVLLANGVSKPVGGAGGHHDEQVAWLNAKLSAADLPVWWVGGAPRHPSRWQRYTYRVHPKLSFDEALRQSLVRR